MGGKEMGQLGKATLRFPGIEFLRVLFGEIQNSGGGFDVIGDKSVTNV
jgi:hypothetical protein